MRASEPTHNKGRIGVLWVFLMHVRCAVRSAGSPRGSGGNQSTPSTASWRHHDIWGDLSAGVTHIVVHVRPACHLPRRRIMLAKKRVFDAAAAAKCLLRGRVLNRITVNASMGAQWPASVVNTLLPGFPRLEFTRRWAVRFSRACAVPQV